MLLMARASHPWHQNVAMTMTVTKELMSAQTQATARLSSQLKHPLAAHTQQRTMWII